MSEVGVQSLESVTIVLGHRGIEFQPCDSVTVILVSGMDSVSGVGLQPWQFVTGISSSNEANVKVWYSTTL